MIAPFESRFRQSGWRSAVCVLPAESAPQDLEQAVRAAMDDLGPLRAAVLVASQAPDGGLLEAGRECLNETLATNVGMLSWVALLAAQRMLEQRSQGSIVFVELSLSDGSQDEGRLSAAGAASGAALESLSRSMCSELGPHGIRVNAVRAQTRRQHEPLPPIPQGHPVSMKCVAEVTAFLAGDEASYMSGVVVPVDGGVGVAR